MQLAHVRTTIVYRLGIENGARALIRVLMRIWAPSALPLFVHSLWACGRQTYSVFALMSYRVIELRIVVEGSFLLERSVFFSR